ncbi:MAG: L,D-transpeptidase, partial [Bdellovibrionota bacterium]
SLGLRLVYPMAAGGLDPGLTENSDGHWTLMTPVFHQAHLTRRNAYAARTNPSYYRGLPFMRVMRQGNEWTEFAFHTRLAREIERPETFRGFNSHGCLHLRDRDLQEMYLLLSRGGLSEIPLNVLWSIPAESFDTPFPSWDSSYQKVANCAASGQDAHSCEDPDTGLTKMFEKPGAPPFDRLVPVNGDHL